MLPQIQQHCSEPRLTTFAPTDPRRTLFFMCFSSKSSCLMCFWLIYIEFKANSTVNRAWMRIIYMGHQSLLLGNPESFGKLCLEHFKWQNYQETAVINTIPINRPQRIMGDSCRYGAVVDDLPTSYKTLSLIPIMEKN